MEYDKIKEPIRIIDNSSIADFELKQSDIYLRMSKFKGISNDNSILQEKSVKTVKSVQAIVPEEIKEPITIIPEDKVEFKEGNLVKAPIVGTFYKSTSPDKPPIVNVGTKVKKGDLLCIIEAMKVMNEIKSEFDGEIAEVLVENEEMVEFGQPMFRIV